MNHSKLTKVFALYITATAMAISAVAAINNGGTIVERALFAMIFVGICAATHVILAISKHPIFLLVWIGCLAGTMYGHLTFFEFAGMHAGEIRAEHTTQTTGVQRLNEAIDDDLAAIKSRPIAIITADLARSLDWRQRAALLAELAEGKRAAALRDRKVRINEAAAIAAAEATTNPVISLIAKATGYDAANITLVAYLGISLTMELVGALLWYEVRRQPKNMAISPIASEQTADDRIANLRKAVASGACLPTVTGIRQFLGCSQATALSMRRAL
jgi:hypothetical protein